jgi:hypothetical protein
MSRAGAALASTVEPSGRAPAEPREDLQQQLSSLKRQINGRGFRPRPGHFMLLAVVILGAWLLVVFGRGLAQLNEAADRQAIVAAEVSALSDRLDAGERELILVQSDAFQQMQARSFGMGATGEIAFGFEQDAATAPLITPLGGASNEQAELSPLDAWLTLLFGD